SCCGGGTRTRAELASIRNQSHPLARHTSEGQWPRRSASTSAVWGRRPGNPGPPPSRTRNTCPRCDSHYREEEMVANLRVCAHCGYHFPVTARERIVPLTSEGSWSEIARELHSADALEFVDTRPYPERLLAAEQQTGLSDAMLVGSADIGGLPVALAVMHFSFLGGSMGSVVGEKVFRAAELAIERR